MPERMILWLGRRVPVSCEALIGPKAAGLCTLRALGVKVPPCFFLTTQAFKHYLDAEDLRSQIASLAARLDEQQALAEIRNLIIGSPFPNEVRAGKTGSHLELGIIRHPLIAAAGSHLELQRAGSHLE